VDVWVGVRVRVCMCKRVSTSLISAKLRQQGFGKLRRHPTDLLRFALPLKASICLAAKRLCEQFQNIISSTCIFQYLRKYWVTVLKGPKQPENFAI